MKDHLRYRGVEFSRVLENFSGNEALEKARRTLLVFLAIVLFIEFAGVKINGATLGMVSATITRPELITAGFWVLFVYFLAIYFLACRRDLAVFLTLNANRNSFYSQLNRRVFIDRIVAASHMQHLQPGSALVMKIDEQIAQLQFDVSGLPADVLSMVEGYDPASRVFTYQIEDADEKFYERARKSIAPAFKFNFLVYVLPLCVGGALVVYKAVRVFIHCFWPDWI